MKGVMQLCKTIEVEEAEEDMSCHISKNAVETWWRQRDHLVKEVREDDFRQTH